MNIFFNFLSKEEQEKLLLQIQSGNLICDKLDIKTLINLVSVCKLNLNAEINYCNKLPIIEQTTNLYSSIIEAKNSKMDNLINLYNTNNTYNKIKFINNEINFKKITYIKNVKIEFDTINFDIPISYKMLVHLVDNTSLIFNIIPFNFNGVYKEFFDETKDKTIFKVSNKNTIYIYDCIYNKNGINIGTQLDLKYNYDYGYTKDGYLKLDRDLINKKQLLVFYQPNENAFEFEINKKVSKIELIAEHDFMNLDKNFEKKLVIL